MASIFLSFAPNICFDILFDYTDQSQNLNAFPAAAIYTHGYRHKQVRSFGFWAKYIRVLQNWYQRIIGNHRLEKVLKIIKSEHQPKTTSPPLNHVLWHHIHMSLKYLPGWQLTTSLGSPFQCLSILSLNKFFQMSNLHLSWWNLRLFPSILSLVT